MNLVFSFFVLWTARFNCEVKQVVLFINSYLLMLVANVLDVI